MGDQVLGGEVVEPVDRCEHEIVCPCDSEPDCVVQVEHPVVLIWVALGGKLADDEAFVACKLVGMMQVGKQASGFDGCKSDCPFSMARDRSGSTARATSGVDHQVNVTDGLRVGVI